MAEKALVDLSLDEFLTRLSSDSPTPGGGSVAALTGALAAALGQMVSGFTLGRKKYADVEPRVREITDRLERANAMFRRLIDEDAAAYGVLNDAMKLDKSDPERMNLLRRAAGLAGGVPLETATLAAKVRADLEQLREIGNPMLRSDADAAIHLTTAALHAAAANVHANLSLMEPTEAAEAKALLGRLLDGGNAD